MKKIITLGIAATMMLGAAPAMASVENPNLPEPFTACNPATDTFQWLSLSDYRSKGSDYGFECQEQRNYVEKWEVTKKWKKHKGPKWKKWRKNHKHLKMGYVSHTVITYEWMPVEKTQPPAPQTDASGCSVLYTDYCLPAPIYWEGRYTPINDVDCIDIQKPVTLLDPLYDPYRLDRDGNGIGCEVYAPGYQGDGDPNIND